MVHHHTSFHSVCRWTFNAGKGGFVPASIRPEWDGRMLDTAGVVRLTQTGWGYHTPYEIADLLQRFPKN